ncbi:MAG: ubiquinone/menaquinone biosynthesis methyltransferase [Anaerolineae bacterium]
MSNPLPPPERKAVFVQEMFGRIAPRYDLMNCLISLGRDRAWRRFAVAQVMDSANLPEESRAGRILDVATGTGDLALEALRQGPGRQIVGLDFVPEMLVRARQKAIKEQAELGWLMGDALRIPCADGVFDGVVTGFALRNVTDISVAFAEMARVTRPGGRIACLEMARPRLPLFRQFFAWYFYRLVPLLGQWIAGQRSAYTYLPHSLTAFSSPDEVAEIMRQTGWEQVRYRLLMGGTVAVHVGIRIA